MSEELGNQKAWKGRTRCDRWAAAIANPPSSILGRVAVFDKKGESDTGGETGGVVYDGPVDAGMMAVGRGGGRLPTPSRHGERTVTRLIGLLATPILGLLYAPLHYLAVYLLPIVVPGGCMCT